MTRMTRRQRRARQRTDALIARAVLELLLDDDGDGEWPGEEDERDTTEPTP